MSMGFRTPRPAEERVLYRVQCRRCDIVSIRPDPSVRCACGGKLEPYGFEGTEPIVELEYARECSVGGIGFARCTFRVVGLKDDALTTVVCARHPSKTVTRETGVAYRSFPDATAFLLPS